MGLSELWPFGKKEEDEVAKAPQRAVMEVPGEWKYGMRGQPEYIQLHFHEDGTIANREKISADEYFGLLRDGEAFKTNEKDLSRLRKGNWDLNKIYQASMEREMEEEAEQSPEVEEKRPPKGFVEKMRKESIIGGENRRNRLDRAIEGTEEPPLP